MKSIFSALLLTLLHQISYAQDSYVKLPQTNGGCMTIMVDDNIIVNESVLASKENIAELSVLKDKPTRATYDFYNLSENGIVLVTLKKKIVSKTQAELNTFFGLDKDNSIYVNGYLIETSTYKIATESIVEVELVPPTAENKLTQKTINIWTLTQDERVNGCKQQ